MMNREIDTERRVYGRAPALRSAATLRRSPYFRNQRPPSGKDTKLAPGHTPMPARWNVHFRFCTLLHSYHLVFLLKSCSALYRPCRQRVDEAQEIADLG